MTTPETGAGTTSTLVLAFAPIRKLALGVAVGMVTGLLLFAVTLGHVALDPRHGEFLALLDQYFYGYTVSPTGAFVGLWWGFVTGFAAGWFMAFVRNFAIAVIIFAFRTRAELSHTSDFLDRI